MRAEPAAISPRMPISPNRYIPTPRNEEDSIAFNPPRLWYAGAQSVSDLSRGDRLVDGIRFDGLARRLGSLADRRTTVRGARRQRPGRCWRLRGWQAEAKKKKKCKKPKVKCGKKCCAAGSVCDNGQCVTCGAGEGLLRRVGCPSPRVYRGRVLLWSLLRINLLPFKRSLRWRCFRCSLRLCPRFLRRRLLSTRAVLQ